MLGMEEPCSAEVQCGSRPPPPPEVSQELHRKMVLEVRQAQPRALRRLLR